jgi:hypothetical protein
MSGMETCDWCRREMTRHGLKSHRKLHCEMRPALVAARSAPIPPEVLDEIATATVNGRKPLQCKCGCGKWVPQAHTKPKRFFDNKHYDHWKDANRRGKRNAPPTPVLTEEEKHIEQMAALVAKNTDAARAADAVPLITGEESHSLWFQCLGVKEAA